MQREVESEPSPWYHHTQSWAAMINPVAKCFVIYAMFLGEGSVRDARFLKEAQPFDNLTVDSRCQPPAFNGIVQIVKLCALSKMCGIATGWIVTRMKHVVLSRNGAMMEFVGIAGSNVIATIISKYPIAACIPGGLPFPAFIRAALVYLLPETSFGVTFPQALIMSSDKAIRLTPNAAPLGIRLSGSLGFLPAATFAKLLGIVRGIMGLHKKLAFLVPSLGTFRDVAGALSIGFYRSNCTTKCVLLKVIGGTMVSFVAVSESPDRQ